MPTKIGIITYPDRVTAIMGHPALGKAFRTHAKSSQAEENTEFLDARYDPKKMYQRFIKSGAPKSINISGTERAKAKAWADAGDWKNKGWKEFIKDCAEECEDMLQFNHVVSFWDSPAFLKIHHAAVKAKMKGSPTKIAEVLGISDVTTLKALMFAIAAGAEDEAKALSDKLVKAENLKFKAKVLVTQLKKAGLA